MIELNAHSQLAENFNETFQKNVLGMTTNQVDDSCKMKLNTNRSMDSEGWECIWVTIIREDLNVDFTSRGCKGRNRLFNSASQGMMLKNSSR